MELALQIIWYAGTVVLPFWAVWKCFDLTFNYISSRWAKKDSEEEAADSQPTFDVVEPPAEYWEVQKYREAR